MEDAYLRLGDHGGAVRENGDQLKQNVLERLALSEPWDLCNEAKVEKCRATRDLRSCGRTVQHLLTSCGHACLCMECTQRCDICPICRTPISRTGPVLRLRLYDECVEAGLLPSIQDEEFREREREGPYWTIDAWRLCSFFDVAVDNNLASLVCHYVTDVCMDEGAISSDPVISMLLDGAVVKEWCKRTLISTVRKLRDIYNSKTLYSKADLLDEHARRLLGLSYVLETLEAPLNVLSASLVELQQLLEGVRIVMQHLELMSWCIRQRFLDNVQSCYPSISHWKAAFQERKSAANNRVWAEYTPSSGGLGPKPPGTLFIEDALSIGLGREEGEPGNMVLDLALLRNGNYSTHIPAQAEYPPESTRAAVDLLFLEGSPDLFFAKKAIFLYYLFDRHWTLPEPMWKHVIEDYVLSFSIPRQSMLESFVFYLLDNNSDTALKEACRWLPEIVGPSLHPKIARVLLERERPDTALSVLQSTGRYRPRQEASTAVPLDEAVTVVRVLLESGVLTEAYIYQQSHCKTIREFLKHQSPKGEDETGPRDWLQEMEVLVGEICWFCIRRNCVPKMLELPWRGDEEKVLQKCLLEQAVENPFSSAGSLLMVFYFQRCRFSEAYTIHKKLYNLEQQSMTESSDKEAVTKLQSLCEYRTKLIEKSLEMLPEVEREQILNIGEDAQEEKMSFDEMEMIPSHSPAERQNLEDFRISKEPAPVQTSFLSNKKSVTSEETNSLTSPFGWGGTRQAHARSIPSKSPLLKSPLLATKEFRSPGLSPLLGKRLRYDTDINFYRHTDEQAEFQGQQQPAPAKKDRTQAMVVTW